MGYIPRKNKPKKTIAKKAPRRWGKKMNVVAVNALVKKAIASNVENKKTISYNYTTNNEVCRVSSTGVKDWFLQKDWNIKLFNIPQNSSVSGRIGNVIKLKRWVIRGQIAPWSNNQTNTCLGNTLCGHIDIYFGRLLTNGEITSTLPSFIDNGSTSVFPTGNQDQIFKPVNKDEYKIYYHKSFKMSPSQNQITPAGGNSVLSNNGFQLIRSFGFDVCQYICKNAVIKFNDSDTDPNHDMIRRLAMWATWTPAIGDMAETANATHFYKINLCSYAEYEDA